MHLEIINGQFKLFIAHYKYYIINYKKYRLIIFLLCCVFIITFLNLYKQKALAKNYKK